MFSLIHGELIVQVLLMGFGSLDHRSGYHPGDFLRSGILQIYARFLFLSYQQDSFDRNSLYTQ